MLNKPPSFLGKHHTEATKRSISIKAKLRIGNKNNRWKGGKPKCLDCGKELSAYISKRCFKCSKLYLVKTNSPNWRGGRIRKVINQRQKERRHKLNISKTYGLERFNNCNTIENRKQSMKLWRIKNYDKVRLDRKLRKALRKQAGKLSIKIIQIVYEDNIKKYGTLTCYLCLNPIPFGRDHLEHKIPLSRNGKNVYNNLAVSCDMCNFKKHNKTEEEYRNLLTNKIGEVK